VELAERLRVVQVGSERGAEQRRPVVALVGSGERVVLAAHRHGFQTLLVGAAGIR